MILVQDIPLRELIIKMEQDTLRHNYYILYIAVKGKAFPLQPY
jgi:hypothetical protein